MMVTVSFDLDGTLVTCTEPRERSVERVRAEIDASVPRPSVEAYRRGFRAALGSRLPAPAPDDAVRRAAFRTAFDAVDADVPDRTVDAFADRYRSRRLDGLTAAPGARSLLADRPVDRDTVVVTNGPAGLQREKLRLTGLAPYVDAVAVAGACGVRKPDPGIFGIAFERADASAVGAIHVGDTEPDIDGARAAGLDPILLAPDGSSPAWLDDDVPVYGSLDTIGRAIDAPAGDDHSPSA